MIARIIRSIRIKEDVWNRFRAATKEDKTWMSHTIEKMIESYLLGRVAHVPASQPQKERESGGAAKPTD